MTDVKVIVGGIVPDEDAEALKRQGVAAVFQPGASLDSIVSFVRSALDPGITACARPPADARGSEQSRDRQGADAPPAMSFRPPSAAENPPPGLVFLWKSLC